MTILIALVIGFFIGRALRKLEAPRPQGFGYSSACDRCGKFTVLNGRSWESCGCRPRGERPPRK